MDSGSSSTDHPPGRTSPLKVADVIGTLIAVLTLALPTVAIAYFSSSSTPVDPWQPPTYPRLSPADRD